MNGLVARIRRNDFAKNVLVLLTGTAMAQIVPLALSPILTRLYSPSDLGAFTIYSALLLSVVALVAGRYDLAVVLPESEEDAKVLVRKCRSIVLCSCLVVTAICAVFAPAISRFLNNSELRLWLYVLGANLLIVGTTQVFSMWLTRTREFKIISVNRVNQSVTGGALQVALPFLSVGGVSGLVLGTLLSQVVALSGIYRKVRVRLKLDAQTDYKKRSGVLMRTHYRMPVFNGPNVLLDVTRTNGINFMISAFFSTAVLGQFGIALRVCQAPISLINGAISQVFYQKLAVTRPGEMVSLVKKSIINSSMLGLVPFALLYFFSPWLFPIVFGAGWGLSGHIAQALTPWLYLNLITSPISNLFIVLNRQVHMLIFSIFYAGAPLLTLFLFRSDIMSVVWVVFGEMAVLLVGFLFLALWCSRSYDRGSGSELSSESIPG